MGLALLGVGILVAFVILGTLFLAREAPAGSLHRYGWFLLHFAIGIVGIAAIAVLALTNTLSAAASAVIASIVAYSLGASVHAGAAQPVTLVKSDKPGRTQPPPS